MGADKGPGEGEGSVDHDSASAVCPAPWRLALALSCCVAAAGSPGNGATEKWGQGGSSDRGEVQARERSLQCHWVRATPHSPVTGFVTSQQLQREGLASQCSLLAPNSWMSQDERHPLTSSCLTVPCSWGWGMVLLPLISPACAQAIPTWHIHPTGREKTVQIPHPSPGLRRLRDN